MARMKTNLAALSLEVSRAWLESPRAGLRPLASVIRMPGEMEGVGGGALRGLGVGEALVFDWLDDEEQPLPPAFLTCPVCGTAMLESALRRVGPGCSLCPGCDQILPF